MKWVVFLAWRGPFSTRHDLDLDNSQGLVKLCVAGFAVIFNFHRPVTQVISERITFRISKIGTITKKKKCPSV